MVYMYMICFLEKKFLYVCTSLVYVSIHHASTAYVCFLHYCLHFFKVCLITLPSFFVAVNNCLIFLSVYAS